jgi:hypothetical protein
MGVLARGDAAAERELCSALGELALLDELALPPCARLKVDELVRGARRAVGLRARGGKTKFLYGFVWVIARR